MEKLNNNRIKEVRLSQNKTQKDVAKYLGITEQALSFYERGKREPKLETWKKLADYFDVPVGYLQGVNNSPDYVDIVMSKIFKEKYETDFGLSEKEQAKIISSIELLENVYGMLSEKDPTNPKINSLKKETANELDLFIEKLGLTFLGMYNVENNSHIDKEQAYKILNYVNLQLKHFFDDLK